MVSNFFSIALCKNYIIFFSLESFDSLQACKAKISHYINTTITFLHVGYQESLAIQISFLHAIYLQNSTKTSSHIWSDISIIMIM